MKQTYDKPSIQVVDFNNGERIAASEPTGMKPPIGMVPPTQP